MLNYKNNSKQGDDCFHQRNRQIQGTPASLKFDSPRNKLVRNPDTPCFVSETTPESLVHRNTEEFVN